MSDTSDQLVFAKEVANPQVSKISAWKILIIDDEEEVHHITKYVLRDLNVLGRPLSFLSASSKKEAETILTSTSDIALILLDVVMEEDDSGLKLVKYIREELKNNFVRIILRTGQPGIAPENKIIIEYDINDYKAKTELTAQKLITTIVSSIRSYKDIMTIERNRLGLKRIIEAAPGMYEVQSLKRFASGTLQQVASILDADENAFYCKPQGIQASKTDNEFIVMAGTGKHEKDVDHNLIEVINSTTLSQIHSVLQNKHSKLFDNTFIGYIETKLGNQNIIVLEDIPPLTPLDIELIEIFSMNMAVAFGN